MNHIKQLDAIRGMCLILVIMTHWIPEHHKTLFGVSTFYIPLFSIGEWGLTTFFVMSGFLITRILLNDKKEAELYGLNKMSIMKNFLVRRSLRIFPIYYFGIALLYLFGTHTGTSIRQDFIYYLTYTSNFVFFSRQSWDGMVSHFWSMAVEEQFYLFWPWIMLFVNQKYLLRIIVAFFFAGVLSTNVIAITAGIPFFWSKVLTPTCFDSFSLGAILAYLMVYRPDKVEVFNKYLLRAAFVCYNIYIFTMLFKFNTNIPPRTLISVCSLYVLVFAMNQQKGIIHKVFLNNRFFHLLGKLSYSMYLFHLVIPELWFYMIENLNKYKLYIPLINYYIPMFIYKEILVIEMFVALMAVSWVTWRFIEYPFNSLKIKFENKVPQVQPKQI